ncbi:MAG: hemerythrin domain-containing protein [Limnochordaceae bacterium]|nr:hemerythrin domain-containing protein [Limnochordaceae bacterium]
MNDDTAPALVRRLLQEHRSLLPALERWVQGLPSSTPAQSYARLHDLARRLRRHAALEEVTLFAAMAEIAGRQALAGYEQQHDDIDELLEQLLPETGQLPDDATGLADRLYWICESHFEIEEKHIFRDACARLDARTWASLWRQAESFDRQLDEQGEGAAR